MFNDRRKKRAYKWTLWPLGLAMTLVVWDMGRFAGALEERARNDLTSIPSVDLIAVLTGGQGRLKEAFRLLENQDGRSLLISGTSASLDDILEANDVENFPDALRGQVHMDPESERTVDNAKKIREVVEELQAMSVLVVTSNYHMQRSMDLIHGELSKEPVLDVAMYPFPVKSPNFDPRSWWKSSAAWRIFISEYLKSWSPL